MGLKTSITRALEHSWIYLPLRGVYHSLFNRAALEHRRAARRFYAQFVSPGDLVFDVGANIGEYTEFFVSLGARVIAVEPHPQCARMIERVRPRGRVTIERVAVAREQRDVLLHLCDDSAAHSTVSTDWIQVAHRVPRLRSKHWSGAVAVRAVTLDSLIEKYGRPQFIKIDVEGYEAEVLKGLSGQPVCLSFEFISENIGVAIDCLQRLRAWPGARLNLTACNPESHLAQFAFDLADWVSADHMCEILGSARYREAATYGEVFVRPARHA